MNANCLDAAGRAGDRAVRRARIGKQAKANLDAQRASAVTARDHAPSAAPDHRPRRAPGQLALARTTVRACRGAAVKADGYGLGARETVEALHEAGCRDFFVSTWAEAEALGTLPEGVEPGRAARRRPGRRRSGARSSGAGRAQHASSRSRAGRRSRRTAPCDVMIDTGMNRLGLRPTEIGAARRPRRSTRCTAISPAPTRTAR